MVIKLQSKSAHKCLVEAQIMVRKLNNRLDRISATGKNRQKRIILVGGSNSKQSGSWQIEHSGRIL